MTGGKTPTPSRIAFPSGRNARRVGFAVAVVAAVLALPMALDRGAVENKRFLDKLRRQIVGERPEIVLIGNSMLETRIDKDTIRRASGGRRISILAKGATASSIWYLYLKNFALAPDPPPKVALITFRDTVLSRPQLRSDGDRWDTILKSMPEMDWDVLRLVGRQSDRGFRLDALLDLYPILADRKPIAEGIQHFARNAAMGESSETPLRNAMDRVFRLGNLRRDLPSEMPDDEDAPLPDFEDTFLPLMLDAAERKGTRLIFYRVRRRPDTPSVTNPERMAALAIYMRKLEDYLAARGAVLIDESDDQRITLGFYADGDHLEEDHQRQYAEMFWERIREYCQ